VSPQLGQKFAYWDQKRAVQRAKNIATQQSKASHKFEDECGKGCVQRLAAVVPGLTKLPAWQDSGFQTTVRLKPQNKV
jgi:hypothetical protein|tara:strand:- start:364 stop:597 length:234 start_codon:yes stop_codon:yes gene_type:complete